MKFDEKFRNPDNIHRGIPFWAWNGELDKEEIKKQIRLLKQMGFGGFFMHPRVGLNTEYLSKKWFGVVDVCVKEAKKRGMNVWIYDEDRWPSGAAGGLVTKNPKYRMKKLVVQEIRDIKDFKSDQDIIKIFQCKIEQNNLFDIKTISGNNLPLKINDNEILIIFSIKESKPDNWYNGYTYLDTLDKESVREFIKMTHEKYKKNTGNNFGNIIPGIFTDEPNYGHETNYDGIPNSKAFPWTNSLLETFKKRYGYDLQDKLIEINYKINGNKVSAVRRDYYDCLTYLFTESFSKQIGNWCEKNNLLFTGHALMEDTLSSQENAVGSVQRFYEFMQAPGIDLLTEYWRIYNTVKQVNSVANQFGRKYRLTETYGCTGWDFNFKGHKALGDWQAALGINLRCQHLSWYTMLGQAKRDYPASIFYQSPWWNIYENVENYFSRINSVLNNGSEVIDVLVINPIESMWTLSYSNKKLRNKLDSDAVKISSMLLQENINFDFGDEDIISRHGKILKSDNRYFFNINKSKYKTIIVPPVITLRGTTLELLKDFADKGGKVIFIKDIPKYINAEKSNEIVDFSTKCIVCDFDLKSLDDNLTDIRKISVTDETGSIIPSIVYILKEDNESYYLFIVNTGHSKKQLLSNQMDDVRVKDRKSGYKNVSIKLFFSVINNILQLDANTGTIDKIKSSFKDTYTEIKTGFLPLESKLFVIPKTKIKTNYPFKKDYKTIKTLALNKNDFITILTENNVLVLDIAEYKIADNKKNKETEILKIDKIVRDYLDIPHRGGRMTQPWAREKKDKLKQVKIELNYEFNIKVIPRGELYLGIEKPKYYEIFLNDQKVKYYDSNGWWCDKSLEKIKLENSLFKEGKNKLTLVCNYTEDFSGLEIVYLLGNFNVNSTKITKKIFFQINKNDLYIDSPNKNIKLGNLVKQGLPFYSGNIIYKTDIKYDILKDEKLFLRIKSFEGTAVKVNINNRNAGIIAWEPQEIEITNFVKTGNFKLSLELFTHRRNSHGPLHCPETAHWYGPAQFITNGKLWSDKYQLVETGINNPVELVVKK